MVLLRPAELSAASPAEPRQQAPPRTSSSSTPSRSPPRAIRSGSSSSRRAPRARGCPPAAGAPARRSSSKRAATSAIGSGEHADAALERLVRQLGAEQPAQRGGGAAHRHGALRPAAARGPRRCPPRGCAPPRARRPRAGPSAGRRRPGSRSRSETTPTRPSPVGLADGDLGGAAAHVDHGDRALGGLSSVRVAPTKDSRASSSPESTLSGMPPASSHRVAPAPRGWARCGWRPWPRP